MRSPCKPAASDDQCKFITFNYGACKARPAPILLCRLARPEAGGPASYVTTMSEGIQKAASRFVIAPLTQRPLALHISPDQELRRQGRALGQTYNIHISLR